MTTDRLRDGFTQLELLVLSVAAILGAAPEHVTDLFQKASEAAKAADCIDRRKACRKCTDGGCEDCGRLENCDECADRSEGEIGFHATTVNLEHPALAGVWNLVCRSTVAADDTGYVGTGAAELSLGDFRILLSFGVHDGLDKWTGIIKVWEGQPYDPDEEYLFF